MTSKRKRHVTLEIIDLSQENFSGMPVFHSLPPVKISVYASHEQWDGIVDSNVVSPAVNLLELWEHTGTHVDSISHMAREYREQTIETMPLEMFYTEGICLDLSHKKLGESIEATELESALSEANLQIKPGDTVLLCTEHYRRTYGTNDWPNGPGISPDAARWLGKQKIAAFGLETMSPGLPGISNKEVHRICGELRFYALREHDQFAPVSRSRPFSLHRLAAEDTWWNRFAGSRSCCLRSRQLLDQLPPL